MPKKYGMKLFLFVIFMIFANFTAANAATVRFYDDSLDLVKTRSHETGSIVDFTQIKGDFKDISFWYTAGGYRPIDNHTVTNDINFYSVPKVQEIATENELNDIRNFLGDRYMLTRDIKLTKVWLPIGNRERPFIGVFNGGGHKISGLWTDNKSVTDFVGLFGRTYGAVIKDIGVVIDAEKGGLSGRSRVGAIVGSAVNTRIMGGSSEGLIKGEKLIGGIAGDTLNSTIKESYSVSDILGGIGVGGIVGGSGYTYFENVRFLGTITIKDIDEGYLEQGIPIEEEENTIVGRYNLHGWAVPNKIKGLVGGIAGYSYMGTIVESHFNGRINGRAYTGGIVGFMVNSGMDAGVINSSFTGDIDGGDNSGGISGSMSWSSIRNSNFNGNINGGNNSGGIAGSNYMGSIIDSNFNGTINGGEHVGGIAGELYEGDIISSNFKGTVKGTKEVGGIVGYQDRCAFVDDSYAQGEITGESRVGGAVGSNVYSAVNLNRFSGSIIGIDQVGGITGNNNGSIDSSYSEGMIKGERDVGGIAGLLERSAMVLYSYSLADISGKENVGGIAGSSAVYTKIIDVYFIGKVKGDGKYTGGIVGYSEGAIEDSYALGSVEGGLYAGGIAGYAKSESFNLIYYEEDSEEIAIIIGGNNVAANSMIKGVNTARIAAVIDGEQKSVPHNFALSTLKKEVKNFSEGDARNGISKTLEELKKEKTYTSSPPEGLGWYFETWTMEGSATGYPILHWQIKKPGFGGRYCHQSD